jgi:hypothetical protein
VRRGFVFAEWPLVERDVIPVKEAVGDVRWLIRFGRELGVSGDVDAA